MSVTVEKQVVPGEGFVCWQIVFLVVVDEEGLVCVLIRAASRIVDEGLKSEWLRFAEGLVEGKIGDEGSSPERANNRYRKNLDADGDSLAWELRIQG